MTLWPEEYEGLRDDKDPREEEHQSGDPEEPFRVMRVEDEHPQVPPKDEVGFFNCLAMLDNNPLDGHYGFQRLQDGDDVLIVSPVGDKDDASVIPPREQLLDFSPYLPIRIEPSVCGSADARDLAVYPSRLQLLMLLDRAEECVRVSLLWVGEGEASRGVLNRFPPLDGGADLGLHLEVVVSVY